MRLALTLLLTVFLTSWSARADATIFGSARDGKESLPVVKLQIDNHPHSLNRTLQNLVTDTITFRAGSNFNDLDTILVRGRKKGSKDAKDEVRDDQGGGQPSPADTDDGGDS